MGDDFDFKRLTFDPGAVLVEEGEDGEAAFLIRKGKVEVRLGMRGEHPHTVATLGPGEVVGEIAMFDGHTHMATVVAVEPTEVSAISRQEFNRRVQSMDPVLKGIILQMVRRARHMADDLRVRKQQMSWSNWKRD